MGLETYPSTPEPSYSYPFEDEYKTLASELGDGESERQSLRRFGKRTFAFVYNKVLIASEWQLIHNFHRLRRGGYEPFWVYDLKARQFVDEFVGRGYAESLAGGLLWDGAAFTNFTTAINNDTANDVSLLDPTPVIGDNFVFGFTDMLVKDVDKICDCLHVWIGTAGVGTWTIVWEFWNGAWTALANVSDGSNGFHNSGHCLVTFDHPAGWVRSTLNGISAYWMRAYLSAYTSMATQPLGNKAYQRLRHYDLPSKSTTEAGLKVYVNSVEKVKDTDWFLVSGGGGGSSDRIRIATTALPLAGDLITADFTGTLRIKGFLPDKFRDNMNFYEDYSDIETIVIREA